MAERVLAGMVQGIDGMLVRVEADMSQGLPMFNLFGSLSPEAREGRDRVRTALKNLGIHLPPSRITVNLAPGDIRKNGTAFDLSIAVALLLILKKISADMTEGILFLGELSLDGSLTPVHGVLPVLMAARASGIHRCIVPMGNLEEASLLEGMQAEGYSSLNDVYHRLLSNNRIVTAGRIHMKKADDISDSQKDSCFIYTDFSEVRGQKLAKRALEIAVAGFHNILLDGPPGVGKSMIASCVPGIMPEMTMEEKIQTSMIYSVKGLLGNSFFLVDKRPFRSPSHNVSRAGMFGGGAVPVPGEVSLAHQGVLFLDEFPEHRREILEMLRVPLESHRVILVRNNRTIEFPADFILIAASNPCPCGYYPDRNRCRCTPGEVKRYQNRISGPMRDRIDLYVRCNEISYDVLSISEKEESSLDIRKRVLTAWERQKKRFGSMSYHFNGRLSSEEIRRFCSLTAEGSRLMSSAFKHFQLSGRAYFRLLKVARTIADLQGDDSICSANLEEALLYRDVSSHVC